MRSMNITYLADLTNAVSDYENAWRAYAGSSYERRGQATVAMADAQQRIDVIESLMGDDGPVMRRALTMAASRIDQPRPTIHAQHLTDDYTVEFILDHQALMPTCHYCGRVWGRLGLWWNGVHHRCTRCRHLP